MASRTSRSSGDRLATFDCVIANPPFSLDQWGAEGWTSDPYGRNTTGVPPASNGDFAWVQHMLASTSPTSGRMAVVVPHGVLFRMGVEGKIRERILSEDKLEAVIGLAPNLFYGAGLAACILVFRQKKPASRKGSVLFIDASHLFRKQKAQNILQKEQADEIAKMYREFTDVSGVCAVVPLTEIATHASNLNITRYVTRESGGEQISVDEAMSRLTASLRAAFEAEDHLAEILKKEGLLK